MRNLITLSVLLITTAFLFGQEQLSQTLKGTIVDKDAEYPLIGVNVILVNDSLNIGTTTDLDGNFKLTNVPIGRQALQLSPIGKNRMLTFDIRFTYAGGRRFTPIDLAASILEDETVRSDSRIYEERYPNYIRPDIKIGLRKNKKKSSSIFFVDFQNFINRNNVFFDEYDEVNKEIDLVYQRGFFPDVRYQLTF